MRARPRQQAPSPPPGTLGFRPNTGNTIGNGFQNFLHVIGGGDGIILAVQPNGDLTFFQYTGLGEHDPSGTLGFVENNPGNVIGNGFQSFRHLFVSPRQGQTTHPKTTIFAVAENGDLLWFRYSGNGEQDPTGTLGFVENNSGNQIGNGFQSFRHLFGGSTDRGGSGRLLFAVAENGDLLYFRYDGDGEQDPSGTLGFERPNQGSQIGNGF